MADKLFKNLLDSAPHKDIRKINQHIINSCFTCKVDELITFIRRLGYTTHAQMVREYIAELKKQFDSASERYGDRLEIDYFCDVGGTVFFDDFMHVYDKDDFYNEMVKFNPDFIFNGELKDIRRKALTAIQRKQFSSVGEGSLFLMDSLSTGLKKIGVDPEKEIGGLSKLFIVAMSMMESIGGAQFYLPKGIELMRIVNSVDIYIDSYTMNSRDMAVKYGVSYKSIYHVIKAVRLAMKEYEEGK